VCNRARHCRTVNFYINEADASEAERVLQAVNYNSTPRANYASSSLHLAFCHGDSTLNFFFAMSFLIGSFSSSGLGVVASRGSFSPSAGNGGSSSDAQA
jgi:hypothetical protein